MNDVKISDVGNPAFLVAKGSFKKILDKNERYNAERSHRKKLANAIYMAIMHHGQAVIRAIGSGAIANAVRSITIASASCKSQGVDIVWESHFDNGSMKELSDNQIDNVTAMVFKLKDWKEWKGLN